MRFAKRHGLRKHSPAASYTKPTPTTFNKSGHKKGSSKSKGKGGNCNCYCYKGDAIGGLTHFGGQVAGNFVKSQGKRLLRKGIAGLVAGYASL